MSDLASILNSRPALTFLITTPADGYWTFGPGSGECVDCPFAEYAGHPDDEYRGDRAKHDYDCTLLGRTVWGADPPCLIRDWQGRAREEMTGLTKKP